MVIKHTRRHEIVKVFVVRDNLNREVCTEKPGAHVAERFYDSKELLIVNFVINLCRGEFP